MSEAMYPPEHDEIEPGIWITSHAEYAAYMNKQKIRMLYIPTITLTNLFNWICIRFIRHIDQIINKGDIAQMYHDALMEGNIDKAKAARCRGQGNAFLEEMFDLTDEDYDIQRTECNQF